jgi:hypothetical protein
MYLLFCVLYLRALHFVRLFRNLLDGISGVFAFRREGYSPFGRVPLEEGRAAQGKTASDCYDQLLSVLILRRVQLRCGWTLVVGLLLSSDLFETPQPAQDLGLVRTLELT